MDKLVLSFNDVPLILIIFQSVLFAILLLVANAPRPLANRFLALFILALGIDALDSLIYWSPSIKLAYLKGWVNIFYYLKFSVYLAAPMLFFYVKFTLFADAKWRRRDWLHLAPLGLFVLLMLGVRASLGPQGLTRGIVEFGLLYHNPFYHTHLLVRHFLYLGYGVACILMLRNYHQLIRQQYSNIEKIDKLWLFMLVGGFLLIWVWVFVSYLLTLFNTSPWLGNVIGISGNFFSFVFVNTLVFYTLAQSSPGVKSIVLEGDEITQSSSSIETQAPQERQDEWLVPLLTKAMEEDMLFLEPELTLEQLASHVAVSPRRVSQAINRYFEQNFFDFVNRYRVEKAAQMLRANPQGLAMLDLMAEAGFNSKSTFYRAFKKQLGASPSDYLSTLPG